MAFNLLDNVKGLFTNDLVNNVASSLGENSGNIQKAVSATVPSVLAGFLTKSSAAGGADSLLNMAREASNSSVLSNLTGLLGGGGSGLSSILNMAGGLFGDKLGGIASLISGFSGIKSSSASSLVSMIAPAALASLGKFAGANNLGASGLLSFLNTQKESILSAVPSGFNLAGALGLGSLGDIGTKLSSAVSGTGSSGQKAIHSVGNAVEEKAAGSGRWIRLIAITVIILALLALLFRQCGGANKEEHGAVTDTVVSETPKQAEEPKPTPPTGRELLKVALPNSTTIDAYKGGIEDRLVGFLTVDWMKLGVDSLKKTWFDFDNLNFETGSATITKESQVQINNIAAILNAFPQAKFKIGGYTDKTGDAATNKKLSQQRADAVTAAIKAAGAKAEQLLGAEGYGSEFATVPVTASDEERRKDRRIAVSVRS